MKASVKVTYSLDVVTVREVGRLARTWKVGKSEVIRRSIQLTSAHDLSDPDERQRKLLALNALHAGPRLSAAQRTAWLRAVREEREAH